MDEKKFYEYDLNDGSGDRKKIVPVLCYENNILKPAQWVQKFKSFFLPLYLSFSSPYPLKKNGDNVGKWKIK